MPGETRKYQQRARAAAAADTRRRILDALAQRLREAPTERVSVDRVAQLAGVSRSTVYVAFGSRTGLFDALGADLWERAGFAELVKAVGHPDAREHLRGGVTAGVRVFAAIRDIARALFSMAQLDPDAVAGTIARIDGDRAGGLAYLAGRLAEQGVLHPDVTEADAAHLLWVLTSFDAFDLLYTGRGLSVDQVADLLVTSAERALYRESAP